MTRKDFELIARALRDARPITRRKDVTPGKEPAAAVANLFGAHDALDNASRFLADALAPTNARFDRARFLDACGVE